MRVGLQETNNFFFRPYIYYIFDKWNGILTYALNIFNQDRKHEGKLYIRTASIAEWFKKYCYLSPLIKVSSILQRNLIAIVVILYFGLGGQIRANLNGRVILCIAIDC